MAGRRPGPSRAEVADDAGVPEWVLTSHRITVVIRDLHEQGLLYNIDDVHRERRRRQEPPRPGAPPDD